MNDQKSDSTTDIQPLTPEPAEVETGPVEDQAHNSESAETSQMPVPSVRSRQLMSRDTVAVLVIDVQEKLLPHIQNHSTIVWNIRRLLDGASVLNVSSMCTEQYPKGLGHTVALISERIAVDDEKLLFSCRDCATVQERLKNENRSQILLCGIESHVCVQQTALDLVAAGFDVWVALDAIGSRYELDHQTAMRRMESAGVSLTTTEAALFEWCEVSGTHEFKRISALVREMAPPTIDIPDARYFPRLPARYVVQTDHREAPADGDSVSVELHFLVRHTRDGAIAREFGGQLTRNSNDPSSIIEKSGTQAVEITADGTAVSVQNADGSIEMIYLPVGDARTNHPRWKVRKSERHIASEQYKHDYEITFQVVDYRSDDTFREFIGYEHRDPESGTLTHVSGVRQIEISTDGHWMVVTELGRAPELIELPAERP